MHPHRIRSLQIFATSSSVFQIGLNWPSDVFPNLTHCACNVWPQHNGHWYTARLTCCTREWCVGWFERSAFLCKQFISCCIKVTTGTCAVIHQNDEFCNISHIDLGSICLFMVDFRYSICELWEGLPYSPCSSLTTPTKRDTVSRPASASNSGRALHFSRPYTSLGWAKTIQVSLPWMTSNVKAGTKTFKLILRRTQHILFTVIWRHTYGKGPFRLRERKPASATWATFSD